MIHTTDDLDGVMGQVTSEFFERLSRGENPRVEEYTEKYPEIADLIRDMFPSLKLIQDAGSIGVTPSAALASGGIDTNRPKQLGDYRILHEIGRGGMGVVYEAEQISLGRRVALKILPFAGAFDHRQLQRFKNEAQAAALLHHANIVPVHGIGSERGVHYYAMQLIDGHTLAEVIRDLRRQEGLERAEHARTCSELVEQLTSGQLPARDDPTTDYGAAHAPPTSTSETKRTPQAALSTERSTKSPEYFRSVAQLGVQVAEALEHAHDEGVVHRDIKPSNLILDQRGKVWVTDFGLALVEANPELTMTGDIVGTLRYMSPEQALGKRAVVDQRADIYSLCATLYESLTLEPVFGGGDRQELIKTIAFEEPRRPQKINRAVPTELETIVLQGLEKHPEDRYHSAQQLADDLQRFLDDRPIHARPPSLLQRTAKWSRHHKSLVASVAVILLLSTIGLAISSVLLTQQRNAARVAQVNEQRQREEAERQRNEAERQAARADAEAEKATTEATISAAVIEFINNDLLGSADPHAEPNRELRVREVLNRVSQNINKRFSEQPLTEAAIRYTIGKAYDALGEYDQAKQHLERVRELRVEKLGVDHADSLKTGNSLAWIYHNEGDYTRSRQLFEEILERSRSTQGAEDEITLDSLARIGDITRHLGHYAEAEKLTREVLEVRRGVLGREHPDTLTSMNLLGLAISDLRRYAEAEELHVKVLEIRRRVLRPEHPLTLRSMSNLANAINLQGRHAEAEKLHRKVLEIRRRVLGPEHPDTLGSMSNLAKAINPQGRHAEAEKLHREGLEIGRRVLGPEHPQTRRSMYNLAIAIDNHGQHAEAEKLFREVLEIRRRVLGPEHPDTLMGMRGVAIAVERQGRYAEPQQLFREVLEIRRRMLGPEHPKTLTARRGLAVALRLQGRHAEAEQLFREVLENRRRVLGHEHPDTLDSVSDLANAISSQGRNAEAAELLREALEIRRRTQGPEHRHTLRCMHDLGASYEVQERYGEAGALFDELVEIQRRVLGKEHRDTPHNVDHLITANAEIVKSLTFTPGRSETDTLRSVELAEKSVNLSPENSRCLAMLGWAHYRSEKWERSIDALQRSCKVHPNGEGDAERWLFLAMAHWHLGQQQAAHQWYTKSIGWIQSRSWVKELLPVREEAEELLDIAASERLTLSITYLEAALDLARTVVQRRPRNSEAWTEWNITALAYCRSRNWQGAEEEARLAVTLAADRPSLLLRIAPLFLLAGHEEEYRQSCQLMLNKWDKWSGNDIGHAAALCSLDPRPPGDPERLLRLAERAVEVGPDWSVGHLNRVYSRVGEYEKAIEGLMSRASEETTDPMNQLDLAIAHHLAGHDADAEAWLEKALQTLEDWDSQYASARMEVEVLLWEAERLIRGIDDERTAEANEQGEFADKPDGEQYSRSKSARGAEI